MADEAESAPDAASLASAVLDLEAQRQAAADPVEVLSKLKSMLDAGLISQSEYDAKKNEILSRL